MYPHTTAADPEMFDMCVRVCENCVTAQRCFLFSARPAGLDPQPTQAWPQPAPHAGRHGVCVYVCVCVCVCVCVDLRLLVIAPVTGSSLLLLLLVCMQDQV